MLDLLLIELCKIPSVSTKTIAAVILAESSANENAYNVNGKPHLVRKGLTKNETITAAERLIKEGESIDMGLMQINSLHLKPNQLTVSEIFEPCTNIRLGSKILYDAYQTATKIYGEGQDALKGALSIYNTGNLKKGHRNGYVDKFYGNSSSKNEDPYTADVSVSLKEEVNYEN